MFIGNIHADATGFKQWLKLNRQLSSSSVNMYCIIINKFLSSSPDLTDIDSFNKFLYDHTIKKRSTYAHYAIKLFIIYLLPKKTEQDQMLERLHKPKSFKNIKRVRKFVEDDKIMNLINALQVKKHRIIAIIQNLTGVRAGDVLKLNCDNGVHEMLFKGKKVLRLNIIGKGEKQNFVYIHDPVAIQIIMDFLLSYCGHPDYYFLEMPTRRLTYGVDYSDPTVLHKYNYWKYWEDFKQAMEISGIEYNDFATHDLRRCFARQVWEKYKDIQILQKILNHEQPATTMRYLKTSGLENVEIFKEMQENK